MLEPDTRGGVPRPPRLTPEPTDAKPVSLRSSICESACATLRNGRLADRHPRRGALMNRFAIRCAAGLSVPFLLVACSSAPSSTGSTGSDAQVTITVGDRPSSSDAANRASFDKRVADFEKANPDIKLNPVETIWDATTFQAQAAGGQLPDVLNVPFTEPQGLIARKQVADLTKVLKDDGLMSELNPNVLKIAQDQSGNVFAVPTAAYSDGLGRGPAVREADRAEDRAGRLRADDHEQHRRLDVHHPDLRLRRFDRERGRQPGDVQRRAVQGCAAVAARHEVGRQVHGPGRA